MYFYWVPSRIKQIAHKVLMICAKTREKKENLCVFLYWNPCENLSHFPQNLIFELVLLHYTHIFALPVSFDSKQIYEPDFIWFQFQMCTLIHTLFLWRCRSVFVVAENYSYGPGNVARNFQSQIQSSFFTKLNWAAQRTVHNPENFEFCAKEWTTNCNTCLSSHIMNVIIFLSNGNNGSSFEPFCRSLHGEGSSKRL